MPIFRIEGGSLRKLAATTLDKERSLQRLLEANLNEALGIHFLASEYVTTMGGRIDTLAVDEAGCPVIIEYKKNRNDNVINQSLSYLKWLRTQKREFFEKLVWDKLGPELAQRLTLDWRNPRVICIAESYSKFDMDTAEVIPLRIELFKFRFYTDQIFSLDSVTFTAEEPAVPMFVDSAAKRPARGLVTADPEETLGALTAKGTPETRALFAEFREWVTNLDEAIQEKPNTLYVAYRVTRNFAEVHIKRRELQIYLRPIDYIDPTGLLERVPKGYGWTLDRRLHIRNAEDLARAQAFVEQSYRDVL